MDWKKGLAVYYPLKFGPDSKTPAEQPEHLSPHWSINWNSSKGWIQFSDFFFIFILYLFESQRDLDHEYIWQFCHFSVSCAQMLSDLRWRSSSQKYILYIIDKLRRNWEDSFNFNLQISKSFFKYLFISFFYLSIKYEFCVCI